MKNQTKQVQQTPAKKSQYFENCRPRTDLHNFQVGVANTVDANIIATYQGRPQEMFDCQVRVQPINSSVDDQISVEILILEQIIPQLGYDVEVLVKLSLCFLLPNFDDVQQQRASGYGFIERTNGKYLFYPDRLDVVTSYIANKYGVGQDL